MPPETVTDWWIYRDEFRSKGPFETEEDALEGLLNYQGHTCNWCVENEGYSIRQWTREIWVRPDALPRILLTKTE